MNENNNQDNIKGRVALGAAGATGLYGSKNMILGKQKMYHGTSMANWDKIKTEGLRASMGGTGGGSAAVNNPSYIDASKGQVHLTANKSYARGYANLSDSKLQNLSKDLKDFEDKYFNVTVDSPGSISYTAKGDLPPGAYFELSKKRRALNEAQVKAFNPFTRSKDGKVMKVNLDYDKFKKMERDVDGGVSKLMAAKGNINVSPEEIAGSSAKMKDRVKHTMKNMPGYIKNNPLRFGAGLALAGGGAYALNKAIRDKEASDIVEDCFEKVADSYDAKRKKQYQQMLKRLYGGRDSMMENLQRTRDPGIYHGTRSEAMSDIASGGLNAGRFREFGKGVFFGDNMTASYYSPSKIIDKETGIEVTFNGFDANTASKEEIENLLKGNDGYKLSRGKKVRLAYPSELKGSKTLYPPINRSMVFDIDDRGFSSVGSHLEYKMNIPRKKRQQMIDAASKLSDEVKEDFILDFNKKYRGMDDKKALNGLEFAKRIDNLDGEYVFAQNGKNVFDRFRPNSKEEFNKMKFFGQSREGRLFDNGIVSNKGTRNEFFIKQDNVPSIYLRNTDGTPLEVTPTLKSAPKSTPKSTPATSVAIAPKPKSKIESIGNAAIGAAAEVKPPRNRALALSAGAGALALGVGAYGYSRYKERKTNKE